jgi:hypothetical protein
MFRNKVALPSSILVIFVLQVHVRALQLNAMAMPPLSRNFLSLEPPTQQHQHSPSVGAGFRSQVQKIFPRRTLSDGAVTVITQDLPKLGAAASQLSKIFPCRIPSDTTLDSLKLNQKVLELKENVLAGELHGAWVEGGDGEEKLIRWLCDWNCGFISTCFDEVAEHEKSCPQSHGCSAREDVQQKGPAESISDGAVTIISQDLPKLGAAASQLSKIFPCRIPSDTTLDSLKLNQKVLELKENGLAGELHGAWVEGGEGEEKLISWLCDWNCGFISTCFDEVAEHEKSCSAREDVSSLHFQNTASAL